LKSFDNNFAFAFLIHKEQHVLLIAWTQPVKERPSRTQKKPPKKTPKKTHTHTNKTKGVS